MNTPITYTENIEQSQNLVSKLTQQILPGLASNMSTHMGDFVSAYKELQTLQIERQSELNKLVTEKQYNLAKFSQLLDQTQERLSSTLQMIREFQQKIIALEVTTPEQVRSQDLLLQAMRAMQDQYLTEMQTLINL
jgi:hypothetical protein